MWCLTSLRFQDCLFVFAFRKLDNKMCQFGTLWILVTSLEFIEFLVYLFRVSSKLGSFQLLFVQMFSLPFSIFSLWDSYNTYVGLPYVPHRSLTLCLLFFNIFFLFLRFNFLSWSSLILFSACLILHLGPSGIFFVSVLYFSAPVFPFGFFYVFVLIIGISFFSPCILISWLFIHFPLVFWVSLDSCFNTFVW